MKMNRREAMAALAAGAVASSVAIWLLTEKEFAIEDYATVPPQDLAHWEAIKTSLPVDEQKYLTKFTPTYTSVGEEENLDELQCPIPMKDRVPNGTGIQCVWASLEMLGRFAEEPKLVNPPLTSRGDCKSYSSPSLAAERLNQLKVKFEQTYDNRAKGVALIRKAMVEGRGCLFGVPHHAMVLVHYDDSKGFVKYVDNSDSRLAVQTMTMERFNQRWDTWVTVIYADNDIIPAKLGRFARRLPIWDMNNPQGKYAPDYIPLPRREDSLIIPH
jgi:hypothetical protein